jgi:hypothetical protein
VATMGRDDAEVHPDECRACSRFDWGAESQSCPRRTSTGSPVAEVTADAATLAGAVGNDQHRVASRTETGTCWYCPLASVRTGC